MWLAALVSISLATPLHLLVAAETPSNVDNLNELRWTEGKCDFGTVPGYWWAGRYKSFSKV